MQFYTSAIQWGNNVLVRGYKDDIPFTKKVPFSPTLYVNTKKDTSEFKTLDGTLLGPIKFDTIKDAKDFVKEHDGVHGFEFFGNTRYNYQWVSENYIGDVDYNFDQLKIVAIDIETSVEHSFPDWKNPIEEILLISIVDANTSKAKVFGVKEYTGSYTDFDYIKCKDETDLVLKFIDFWSEDYPNIVTGWNTDGFDWPYMYARISRILGDSLISKLSPFGIVNAEEKTFNDQVELNVDIVGVSSLDYIKLYKKFGNTTQENYKLETVIQEELGLGKLENPFETFKEWYNSDWNSFTEYNYIDSERIMRLEDKKNLIKLVVKMAYIAKVNYQDVFSPVRTWDTLIYNYLYDQKIIVPQSERSNSEETIEGAYVKEPIPGLYDWVVSFDLNSLYPHIIMALNMSPETLNGMVDVTVEQLLNGDFSKAVDGHSLAANGSIYDMSKSGFLSDLMRMLYDGRKVEKKQMLKYESELEKVRATSSTKEIKKLESLITTKDSIQNALKTLMNSGYGALANKGFRFFDPRLAEGITMTGQLIIQTAERNANEYINKLTKLDEDVVIASDTDSVVSDTIVYVNGNKIKIADLFDSQIETVYSDDFNRSYVKPAVNLCTLAFDTKTQSIVNANINYVMKHQVKKRMYQITIGETNVIVTEDHSVIVKRNNRYISVKPENLNVKTDKIINIDNSTICINKHNASKTNKSRSYTNSN